MRWLQLLRAWLRTPLGPWKMVMANIRRWLGKESTHTLAEQRLITCMHCPHLDRNGDKCLIPDNKPCCGICGCALSLKIYGGKEDCPLGKWNK